MLRRRSRPPAAPPPRSTAIRVLAGAPHRVEPVSADLLPSRDRRGAPAPTPVAVGVAVATTSASAGGARRMRRRTIEERAAHIRAMAHAAARRAAGVRR